METSRATCVEGTDHGTNFLASMPVYGIYVEHWKDIMFDVLGLVNGLRLMRTAMQEEKFKACTESTVVRLRFVVPEISVPP